MVPANIGILTMSLLALIAVLFLLIKWRVNLVRKQEQAKAAKEKTAYLLQVMGLHIQVHPHFVLNCLNSIKSLVEMNHHTEAIDHLELLGRFTKRVIQYAGQPAIPLSEELEMCHCYLQLEMLHLGNRMQVIFIENKEVDTSQITVPVLLIQAFIENAIWHGLVPKKSGLALLKVIVQEEGHNLLCMIEDNGIGRAAARSMHAAIEKYPGKGMTLSHERIKLHNRQQQESEISLTVEDKFNREGEADGTLVIIKFINNRYK